MILKEIYTLQLSILDRSPLADVLHIDQETHLAKNIIKYIILVLVRLEVANPLRNERICLLFIIP
jgi:hypothetical protein